MFKKACVWPQVCSQIAGFLEHNKDEIKPLCRWKPVAHTMISIKNAWGTYENFLAFTYSLKPLAGRWVDGAVPGILTNDRGRHREGGLPAFVPISPLGLQGLQRAIRPALESGQ